MGLNFSYAEKLKNMKNEYIFEVNFPFEQRELGWSGPKLKATFNGKIIFNKASWSHPITEAPARVEGLKSDVDTISLHVMTDKGIEKTFSIHLKNGVYIFIYFDIKKNEFSIKQEREQRGYD